MLRFLAKLIKEYLLNYKLQKAVTLVYYRWLYEFHCEFEDIVYYALYM